MESIDPGAIIGTAVVVLAVVAFLLVVVWMPIQIRREQREIEAQRLEPIHVELVDVTQVNEDGVARQSLIRSLTPQSALMLKRKNAGEPGYPGVDVCLEGGEIIGRLPSDPGEQLSRELGLGHRIDVAVAGIDEDGTECSVEVVLQRQPEAK